jgi:hypothetical protein
MNKWRRKISKGSMRERAEIKGVPENEREKQNSQLRFLSNNRSSSSCFLIQVHGFEEVVVRSAGEDLMRERTPCG